MKHLFFSNQFKKDFKKAKKKGRHLKELEIVIHTLSEGTNLPLKYRDHKLIGEYNKCRECHIAPDFFANI